MYFIFNWQAFVSNNIIGGESLICVTLTLLSITQAITIIRLHAMYQHSKRMLIFLILIYSSPATARGVIMVKRSITFMASGQLELEMEI